MGNDHNKPKANSNNGTKAAPQAAHNHSFALANAAVEETTRSFDAARLEKVKHLLVTNNFVHHDVLERLFIYAQTHHINFLEYLISQNVISKDQLGSLIGQTFGIGYADLERYQPSKQQISMIPAELGQNFRAVVFRVDGAAVVIATDDPMQPTLLAQMKSIFVNKAVSLAYAMPDDIDALLVYYRKPLVTRFNQIITQQQHVAPEIIDEIVKDAIAYKVSDIHFEPEEDIVVIRFRIDGLLQEAGQLPKQYYENILNRLKIQAHIRIDEHNTSQDGAIRYMVDDQPVDIRISIVPTLDGEKVAMRLLAEYSRNLSFKNLGLSQLDQKIINDPIKFQFHLALSKTGHLHQFLSSWLQ